LVLIRCGEDRQTVRIKTRQDDWQRPRQPMKTKSTEGRANATARATDRLTLSIDVGGTNIKASVVDRTGKMVARRVEVATPRPATPKMVLDSIADIVPKLPTFSRISAGFPGVVKSGRVLTAPNLGTRDWRGFDLAAALEMRFMAPARVLNDAAVQGLGVVQGRGLECVLTLGTGVGCALYRERRLILPLELGQHIARGKKTYDEYLGNGALEAHGRAKWNRRLSKALERVQTLVNYDVLYLGGGNARQVELDLPENVRIVSNIAGITGGIRLWDPDMDEHFAPGTS
jgi:polyphosphate glucokinase